MDRFVNPLMDSYLAASYAPTYISYMELADRLKEVMRERRVKSQSALGRMSGVPQPTINRLLRGHTENPDSDTIAKLAIALSIHAEWLLTGRGEKELPHATNPGARIRGTWPFAFPQHRFDALPREHKDRVETYALATVEMWEASQPKRNTGTH
ncbi:helix-turn-helix domain-containing protein [Mycetohabitans rhizoxinica]|uniref:Helix-turn-helix domain-containing protein n=1 Tax=Mycetohabitans rhizoxinica TaxID=412963 RepID=A0ABZ2PX57_9BURK